MTPRKILLVDLNNFARYPTLAIGYLAAVLRRAGHEVVVFAPLMMGVRGVTREPRLRRWSLAVARANYLVATSRHRWLRGMRDRVAKRHRSEITSRQADVVARFRIELSAAQPDLVMVSTYLMYKDVCAAIAAVCRQQQVPMIIGGPYFAQNDVIAQWLRIDGLRALAAGEVELQLPAVIESLVIGDDLSRFEGFFTTDGQGRAKGVIARPLLDLDAVPFPDYSDFPWEAYPSRMVPVITGRGCGWGACTFCSDVTSTAGRTYRSRSIDNVVHEIEFQREHHGASHFVFTDLKLNSNVSMWRAIGARMQRAAPDCKWIASVHVGNVGESGLSRADLDAAAKGGCVRLTTGLETGSQRLSDFMRKGTRVDAISRMLRDATAAGISCRCTMILGYPGETAADVLASTEFLERNQAAIERVLLNRLQIIAGTDLHDAMLAGAPRFHDIDVLDHDASSALIGHRYRAAETSAYRRAVMGLLRAVHRINSKDLSPRARDFEGVM